MSKRKRELTQRLEELFSAPAGPEESTAAVPTSGAGLAQLVQALAAQNDPTFFATLLDHIPLPIYIKDRDHKWIAVNPGFAQLLKRTADQLIGHADKEQSDDEWQHDDRVLETGQPEEAETSTPQPAGAPAMRHVTRLPLLNAAGVAEFMIGIIRPAGSPPVQPEPNQLGSVLQSLIEGYYEVDLAGSFVVFNQAVCDIFGYSADELLGLNDRQYTDPETAKLLYATYNRVYQTGESAKGFGWPIIRKDGATRYVEASISLVRDRDGKPTGFRGIVRDITERKLVEGQVLQRNMQLAVLNRIGQKLSHLAEPAKIFELLYEEMGQVLNNENLYIALYDEATNLVSFPVYSIGGIRRSTPSRPFGSALTEHLIRTKEPLLIARNAAAEIENLGIASSGQPAQSWMGAPLLIGEKAIGVIAVQDYEKADAFRPDQLDVLATVASQAAIALENARLFIQIQQELTDRKLAEQAAQRRADQLAALNRVGQQLVQIKPIDEILETIFQAIGEVIDNRNFFIALHDEGEAEIHYPVYTFDSVRSEPHNRAYGFALTEYVLTTKQPLLIAENVNGFLTSIGIQSVGRSAQCWMGVPLLVGSRAIGVIALQDYARSNVYTQNDVELLAIMASQAAIALQNARLFAQTRARIDELAALNEIGRAASGLLDVHELFELAYRQVVRVMRADGFFVGLYDPDRQMISYPVCYDGGEIFTEPDSPMNPNTHSYQVITSGQPLFVEYTEEQRKTIFSQPETMIGDKEGLPASVIFAPLKAGDQILGVISVQSYEAGQHTPENLNLMVSIANQVAVSLENARLFNETQRLLKETEQRNAELAIINNVQAELAAALAAELNIQGIYDTVGDKIREIFHQTDMAIRIYDPQTNFIHYPYVYENGQRIAIESTPLPDKGFGPHVLRTRETLVVNENMAQVIEEYGSYTLPGTQIEKSLVMVPLIAGGQARGLIHLVDNEREHAFSDSDVRLLQTLANSMSVALENARLFEQTRSRAEELTVLNEVAQRLSTRLSIEQVLDETYQGVKRLIDAANFYIGLYDQPKHQISFLINVTESVTDKQITTISADEGISGYIVRNRISVLLGNGIKEWAEKTGMPTVGQDALSWLGVPMIVGDQVMGVMAVQNYEKPQAYTEHDRSLLTVFANQTGIAIQNALLFERTQQDAARERTINRISAKIRNTQSVEQILRIATEELRLATQSARSIAQIAVAPDQSSTPTGNGDRDGSSA